jgi:DNA-binding NarL/FixJ family response regulator
VSGEHDSDRAAAAAAVKARPRAGRSPFVEDKTSSPHNGASNCPPVAVCIRDRELRDRVCAALAAGGHGVQLRVATLDDLLAACNDTAPACLVITAERPDRATVDAVQAIRAELDAVAVVLVCRHAGAAHVRRALVLGVDGVVLIDQVEAALAAVVGVVCAGQVSVPSERRREVRTTALTTREKQILALVVAGLTNAQIAHELYLAESTIKSHLSSAFAKLGVSSRNEAVVVIVDPVRGRGLGIREIHPRGLASAAQV